MLADRYRLEEPLGRGSTAHVWRARDRELGRVVAVKLLGDSVDPELRARFGREGSILGRLSHPNLVAVHGTGLDGERPFLVMDFVDGTAFSDVLANDGPMPWEEAASTVAAVAAGLAEAHRAGVCHRDVKPANVVCGHDGVPRLVDFGIARAPDITTMTRADIVLGTSSYLSPEQAQALPVTPAADVYSLGCVLFEAVAGRPPFEGDGPLQVALKHINEEAPALSSVAPAPDVPGGLDAVVACCLAKAPADRYPTAAELEADLRRVVAGEAPLLVGAAADLDEVDPGATTAIPVAAIRDGTMVLPAVDVAPSGEVIDPSPLAEEPPAVAPVAPLSLPSLPRAAGPWRNLALAVGALILVALLATAAFGGSGGGVDGPELDQTPASADEAPATTVTTAPPTTAVPPPTEAPAPAGKGKGGGKKDKDDDD